MPDLENQEWWVKSCFWGMPTLIVHPSSIDQNFIVKGQCTYTMGMWSNNAFFLLQEPNPDDPLNKGGEENESEEREEFVCVCGGGGGGGG